MRFAGYGDMMSWCHLLTINVDAAPRVGCPLT
jgi:hypothetical protein